MKSPVSGVELGTADLLSGLCDGVQGVADVAVYGLHLAVLRVAFLRKFRGSALYNVAGDAAEGDYDVGGACGELGEGVLQGVSSLESDYEVVVDRWASGGHYTQYGTPVVGVAVLQLASPAGGCFYYVEM